MSQSEPGQDEHGQGRASQAEPGQAMSQSEPGQDEHGQGRASQASRQGATERVRPVDVARGAVTAPDGLLLVDKDLGITSHDVVSRVRRLAATRKVGHAGTLDPMATGLLTVGVGKATRLLNYLVGADKTYEATIRLGVGTDTEDAHGQVTQVVAPGQVDLGRLQAAAAQLTGPISQVPSNFSAIKVNGVRAYDLARSGQEVELEARQVTIHSFDLGQVNSTSASYPGWGQVPVVDVKVQVSCSSGTYIRALARDFGLSLQTVAHLTTLRRTLVGPFKVSDARTLSGWSAQVAEDADSADPKGLALTPLPLVLRQAFNWLVLDPGQVKDVRQGKFLPRQLEENVQVAKAPVNAKQKVLAALDMQGEAVALLKHQGKHLRPVLVFAGA